MRYSVALALIFLSFLSNAQPKIIPVKSTPSIKSVVEKVAMDYYQNFNDIKGDTLNQSEGTIEFTSKIAPEGSIETSITKYEGPYSYAWQTTMYQSEDYQASVDKYKEYYRQLNGCTLTFYNKISYKLSGNYDTPGENRTFASSILKLDNTNPDLKLFKVEVALNYAMPYWKVRIMVYEKVSDKDIRPTVNRF